MLENLENRNFSAMKPPSVNVRPILSCSAPTFQVVKLPSWPQLAAQNANIEDDFSGGQEKKAEVTMPRLTALR